MSGTQVRAPMPGDVRPRQRYWALGAAGLLAIMAYVAWWSIQASSVPSGYLARHGWDVATNGPWRFPHEQVRSWFTAMGIEGALSIWVLSARWSMPLASRSLLLALGTFLMLMFLLPFVMHSSAPFPQHLSWLVFSFCWLISFAIGVTVVDRVARFRRSRRPFAGPSHAAK